MTIRCARSVLGGSRDTAATTAQSVQPIRRFAFAPAQYRHLVAQREYLDILRRR